jgi:hypothetical protein
MNALDASQKPKPRYILITARIIVLSVTAALVLICLGALAAVLYVDASVEDALANMQAMNKTLSECKRQIQLRDLALFQLCDQLGGVPDPITMRCLINPTPDWLTTEGEHQDSM